MAMSRRNQRWMLVSTLAAAQFSLAQTYRIEELPPLNTAGISLAPGINDAGVAVGRALTVSGEYHAVRWVNGSPIDLGVASGQSESIAFCISNDGFIVGWSGDGCNSTEATGWDSDGAAGLPGGASVVMKALQLNESGVAVGEGWDSCGAPWSNVAYRWTFDAQKGSWSVAALEPCAADPEAGAHGINESGVVVGYSGDSLASFKACRWDDLVPSEVPDLGGGHSIALAINDLGQIAGYSRTTGGEYRAWFFDGIEAVDLGVLDGYAHSAARSANNAGTVVGHAFNGDADATFWPYFGPDAAQRAFVWRDGAIQYATDLVPAGSGWTSLNSAADVSERGQITGYGVRSGRYRAFLMTPECMYLGDLNDDRTIDLSDLGLLLAEFGCTDFTCVGDVTGDGATDLSDLGVQLANFGATCE